MADIVDPVAIAFSEEHLRPVAERLRDLLPILVDILGQWNTGGSAAIPNNAADFMQDANGTSHPYHGANAWSAMNTIISLHTTLDGVGVMDNINPITVRPLEVSS